MRPAVRKWLAFGTGVGIEMLPDALRVSAVRMRPGGARALGQMSLSNWRQRPAAEWGAEYAAFLRTLGAGHVAATVLLPRREVIVRPVALPGVSEKDLGAALAFEMEGLHPYGDEEVATAWARLGGGWVLVAIARSSAVNGYVATFAEAGVKVAAFTASAAALYAVRRLTAEPAGAGLLIVGEGERGLELYGESPARPVFSASFPGPRQRAVELALAELRLPPETPVAALERPLAEVAAAVGALPLFAPLPLNLLPEAARSSSSRMRYVPTLALAALAGLLLVALAVQGQWEDHRYERALEAEIAALEPRAARVAQLDREIAAVRARVRELDEFAARGKADLDALREVTRLIPPPAWLHTFEMNRTSLVIGGEADQAAPLLKVIDGSPLFQGSEFTMPLTKGQAGEAFRIRAAREGSAQVR